MKHITFSTSAGGSLRYGFKASGDSESVLVLSDTLNVGPINEPWNEERRQFINSLLLNHPFQESDVNIESWSDEITEFWRKALIKEPKIIWWSSNSAMDWCGLMMLLEYLEQDIEIKLIDVSKIVSNRHIISVGELPPEELVVLKTQAVLISETLITKLKCDWLALKAKQDKPVRWLTSNGLKGIKWSELDSWLLDVLESLGKVPSARFVGECLGIFSEEFNQVSDTVLWYRLQALIGQKKIKIATGQLPIDFNTPIERT